MLNLSVSGPSRPFFRLTGPAVQQTNTDPPVLTDAFRIPLHDHQMGCVSGPGCILYGDLVVGLNLNDIHERPATARAESGQITITLTREGTRLVGEVLNDQLEVTGTVSAAAIGNGFAVLKFLGPVPPPPLPGAPPAPNCGRVRVLGWVSVSAVDPNQLLISGSGVETDCSHSLFSISLTR